MIDILFICRLLPIWRIWFRTWISLNETSSVKISSRDTVKCHPPSFPAAKSCENRPKKSSCGNQWPCNLFSFNDIFHACRHMPFFLSKYFNVSKVEILLFGYSDQNVQFLGLKIVNILVFRSELCFLRSKFWFFWLFRSKCSVFR